MIRQCFTFFIYIGINALIWSIGRWLRVSISPWIFPYFYPIIMLVLGIIVALLVISKRISTHNKIVHLLLSSGISYTVYSFLSINRYETVDIFGVLSSIVIIYILSRGINLEKLVRRKWMDSVASGIGATGIVLGIMMFLYPIASLFGTDSYQIFFSILVAIITYILFYRL